MLVISYGRLILNGTAGSTVMCGLVEAALKRNFDVAFLGLVPRETLEGGEIPFSLPKTVGQLTMEECCYLRIESTKWQGLVGVFDPGLIQRLVKSSHLLAQTYDAVVAFDSLPIHLATAVRAKSKFLILGDPTSERLKVYQDARNWCQRLIPWLVNLLEAPYFRKTLPRGMEVGMFGTRHAREWSRKLDRSVIDLRPMMPTYTLKEAQEIGDRGDGKIRVVFWGSLGGTASRVALPVIE